MRGSAAPRWRSGSWSRGCVDARRTSGATALQELRSALRASEMSGASLRLESRKRGNDRACPADVRHPRDLVQDDAQYPLIRWRYDVSVYLYDCHQVPLSRNNVNLPDLIEFEESVLDLSRAARVRLKQDERLLNSHETSQIHDTPFKRSARDAGLVRLFVVAHPGEQGMARPGLRTPISIVSDSPGGAGQRN